LQDAGTVAETMISFQDKVRDQIFVATNTLVRASLVTGQVFFGRDNPFAVYAHSGSACARPEIPGLTLARH
jgi:hypothetical protein